MPKKKKTTGRDSKYNEDVKISICKYLREGNTIKDSCALIGISTETYYKWIEKRIEFADAIMVSEAEAARERVQRVRAAGVRVRKRFIKNHEGKQVEVTDVEGDWKADAWWLERRRRGEFASKLVHGFESEENQGIENALQLVGALLEGTKTGRRKDERST